jgi:acetolactate synthase I/II/III large subunit
MTGAFGAAYGTELSRPDFVALAEALGVPARQTTPESLEADLTSALAKEGPASSYCPRLCACSPPAHTSLAE